METKRDYTNIQCKERMIMQEINVLMCGSDLKNGGGVVSVTNNYLNYPDWEDVNIRYIPTHVYGGRIRKIVFF